jgi:hypothetical protein
MPEHVLLALGLLCALLLVVALGCLLLIVRRLPPAPTKAPPPSETLWLPGEPEPELVHPAPTPPEAAIIATVEPEPAAPALVPIQMRRTVMEHEHTPEVRSREWTNGREIEILRCSDPGCRYVERRLVQQ